MSQWLQWSLFTMLTGSPLLALGIVVAMWWAADRFTLRIVPDPVQACARYQRASRLRRRIAHNPHDRPARRELADLLVGQRRYAAAVEVLKVNLEAGDDDGTTLLLAGIAHAGAGSYEDGERLLLAAREGLTEYQKSDADLEIGRYRLKRGDGAGAREALETYCAARPGTVEGKVLLGRAYVVVGDAKRAAETKRAAWADYVAAPRFQRRRERFWAWRANPARPLLYAGILVFAVVILVRWVVPAAAQATREQPAAISDIERYGSE